MRNLVLDGTNVSDRGLEYLRGMDHLEEWLGLVGTRVTDTGLHYLEHQSKLGNFTLIDTHVTPASVRALKEPLPNTSISCGGGVGI